VCSHCIYFTAVLIELAGEKVMTVKRFVAPDMRRALDLVRLEMGADAIILSSQRTHEGVEIITSDSLDFVARGGAERKEFGNQFDRDLDRPLASDTAWQAHEGVAAAARAFPPVKNNSLNNKRREELAKEIEAARERMLAAKTSENNSVTESPSPQFPEPETVRWQPSSSTGNDKKNSSTSAHSNAQKNSDQHNSQTQSRAEPIQRSQSGNRQMAGIEERVNRMAPKASARPIVNEADDKKLAALQSEIADMRIMLEQQLWRMQDQNADKSLNVEFHSPMQDVLQSHLVTLGLPGTLVKKLVLASKPDRRLNAAWRDALALLTHQLKSDNSDLVQRGGIFAFVGATGVGKTTTIAKLAARFVLENGLGKVALVTTDTFRVGAHDQLRSLGRILNVPVRVVDQERSLATVIAGLKNYPLILIDTAGFRQGDPLLKEQNQLLDSCPGLQRILVMACNSQIHTLKASLYAYNNVNVKGVVLSKLDECGSLGEALGVVIQQQIPVLYTTDGQTIPNDIAVASSAALVAKAVSVMKAQQKNRVLSYN
jgi:flagellar biosynthesis protein FlhF